MTKSAVALDDKYLQPGGRVFLSANQALVRLPLDQARRDRAAGLKTAGYISGYRGSPLGVYDSALWAAGKLLQAHDIRFVPGLNEELAVSAIRGTQEIAWFGKSVYEGVFGLWYGKGIGVDRACESLKLGNLEGTASKGKAYLDVRQALADLGLDEHTCRRLGIRLYKPGLTWPMDRERLIGFAAESKAGRWHRWERCSHGGRTRRHGGPPRRQRMHDPRYDWHGSEGRRGNEPHPHRRGAAEHPLIPPWRRHDRPAARLRLDRRIRSRLPPFTPMAGASQPS